MMRTRVLAGIVCCLAVSAATFEADSKRGAALFRDQMCTNCHSVQGEGANAAPDLGRRLDRNYTPAGITSLMWNHAPAMWAAMQKQKLALPQLSESQAADLFAYFYASHYFEKPGEAQRGKALFASKHCAECHSLTPVAGRLAPPVTEWKALTDPVILVQRMWEHAPQMLQAMNTRAIQWPELTAQDMTDLLVYLQNLPQTRGAKLEFELPPPAGGDELFHSKGCASCHVDQRAFEALIGDSTLTDIAAALWNHGPEMEKSPATAPKPIAAAEMRKILSYVWARQFFSTKGDDTRGKRVFESNKCAVCHNDASSGAPALGRIDGPFSAVRMVSVLWKHGPAMLQNMKAKNIAWPRLTPTDMANLVAYLNSR